MEDYKNWPAYKEYKETRAYEENSAVHELFLMSRIKMDPEDVKNLEATKRLGPEEILEVVRRRKAMRRSNDLRSRSSCPYATIKRNVHRGHQRRVIGRNVRRGHQRPVERNVNNDRRGHGRLPRMGTPLRSLVEGSATSSAYWEKVLTTTDVEDHQGRLMFNGDFADTVINQIMLNESEKPTPGVRVTVYSDQLAEFEMAYKHWSNKKKVYVLACGWKAFRQSCRLEVGQTIYLWVFRRTSTNKLCFAISTIQPE